jgi:predicted DNA-binding transcriptional regulator AlpA
VLTPAELEDMLLRCAKLAVAQFSEELERCGTREIMTKAQAATYIGCSVASVTRFMRSGLPHHKKDGGYPRFYKSEIDDWVKAR